MVVVVVVVYQSTYLSICNLQAWKRSNSARFPQLLNLITSKRKQSCETSSIFEVGNMKNEASLRDVLNFWRWQQQKRSNSARLPSIMESWMQSWRPHVSEVLRLPRKRSKKRCQVIRSAATVTQNHLPKTNDLMLQNATLSGNQRPDLLTSLMNMSLVLRLPREIASFQILFKCPTPAIVFGNATKPSRFPHFWYSAQSLAPATRNDNWTLKSGPNMWCS